MVLLWTHYVKENSLYATHAVTDTNASLRQLMKCFGNKIHIVQYQTEGHNLYGLSLFIGLLFYFQTVLWNWIAKSALVGHSLRV